MNYKNLVIMILSAALLTALVFLFFNFKAPKASFSTWRQPVYLSKEYIEGKFIGLFNQKPVLQKGNTLIMCKNNLLQEIIARKELPGETITNTFFQYSATNYYYFFCVLCKVDGSIKLLAFDANLELTKTIDTKANDFIGCYPEKKYLVCRNNDSVFIYNDRFVMIAEKKLDKDVIFPKPIVIENSNILIGFDGSNVLQFNIDDGLAIESTKKICDLVDMNNVVFSRKPSSPNYNDNHLGLYNGKTLYYLDLNGEIITQVDLEGVKESVDFNVYPYSKGLYYIDYDDFSEKIISKHIDDGSFESVMCYEHNIDNEASYMFFDISTASYDGIPASSYSLVYYRRSLDTFSSRKPTGIIYKFTLASVLPKVNDVIFFPHYNFYQFYITTDEGLYFTYIPENLEPKEIDVW